MKSPIVTHEEEVAKNIETLQADKKGQNLALEWMTHVSANGKYSYNFNWLGRPIIQFPQDIVAMQELIFDIKPDLIIETGIAHGGSLIFHASMLALLDTMFPDASTNRKVLGVDIEIRPHNRHEIENHPLYKYIEMYECSSTDPAFFERARSAAAAAKNVLVLLDSNHSEDHVLQELELYSELVTSGSYLVVFDTIVEKLPAGSFPNRPWDVGNNPMTAVNKFLKNRNDFLSNNNIDGKLQISVAPNGWLLKK